jgi:ACS family glucarate transporter-like MFS transporter
MSTSNSALPALSRTRYWVVVYAVVLSVITYVDRVSISQAAPLISEELGLSRVQMGWAFSAFSLGYFLFQIPGGWMSDWVGPRRILTGIVIWWSVFTAATGWAWNLVTLIAARLLFGVGQAGGFPVLTKTFTAWLPRDEQVRAQGIMWLSARWGGAAAPMIVVTLIQFASWRRTFEVLGVLGLIWAIFFWRWYRDSPRDHASVSQAELAIIGNPQAGASGQGNVPWARFLSSPSVWFLFLQYFCISWGWYFYITWLPTYIQEARGQTMEQSALLAGIPLFFGGIGSLFCGFILSRLGTLLGSERLARRGIAGVGNFAAGACLVVSVQITEPLWAVVAMGFASFANDLSMPPAWAACMDLGGRYAGALSGAMNAAGNLAGFIAPPAVAYILSATGDNWPLTFYVSAGTYFVAALCWIKIDPVTSLDRRG